MIDTRKCRTGEEVYDAMDIQFYVSGLNELLSRASELECRKRILNNHITNINSLIDKYNRYISAYKQVYPERPWEDIE